MMRLLVGRRGLLPTVWRQSKNLKCNSQAILAHLWIIKATTNRLETCTGSSCPTACITKFYEPLIIFLILPHVIRQGVAEIPAINCPSVAFQ